MEASESIYVASPKIKDPEVAFQSFDSPNPDLDHARSDTGNTAEELTAKFQQLVLKEQWEPAPKDEDEKDGNWGLKEAEDGQEAEKGLGGSHWEEVKAGESEWNGWGDNGNDNGVVIDVVVVEEGSEAEDGSERYGGTDTKRYQYQYPVRPEAEDCAFYLKTGTCKFGSTCRFNHPVRRKNQAVKEKVKEKEEPTERLGQTACKYYMRSGGCKYGDACKYSHTRDKISGTTLLELNFLGLPIRPGEKECPFYMRTGSCKYGANCRFNHPDPTAVGGSDNPSGYGNGGSTTLDASQSSIASWSSSRKFNETAPFAPIVLSPSHGVPSQNPEWNGLQAPVYLPERSMHPPVTYVMSPAGTETNVYTHHKQQIQVEEYPERPGYPECSYFLKTGDCKYKSNCRYHHPKDRIVKSPPCALSDKGLPLRPDQNICAHYSRYGICKFGPACKFDHPLHRASSAMTGVDQHLPYGDSVTTDKAVGGGIGSEATFRQSQ
ncbi:zinc finger CCCH domain-containing protein 43-like isoform X2 [Juglans regia]|uniref:Zinc finger CCCH domain-containing protein 43-like isoform X2 n=2 Tax=Juglans regia TaxID=51240 RepID=A0A2I4DK12_JUGRE|nr:zinc finger CCCH domain-containing protein 43-like isoform X2 [Juglans regia]